MKPELRYLDVKVSPKASRDAVLGWYGDALKIAVTAAPERGRANAAVAALLAETLRIPVSRVEVVAGHAAARKRLAIEGLTQAELYARLPQR
jgi:uncharacterized protein (TIGR00251 family)